MDTPARGRIESAAREGNMAREAAGGQQAMAASSFASPSSSMSPPLVCCFCCHFFDLKEGESFSSRRGKSETVQLQPSQKDRIFFGREKENIFFF
jgi:hypothetical protein